MMLSYIVAFILAAEPYPTFALLGEYDTLEKCRHAIEVINATPAEKARMDCLALGREIS